MINQDSPIDGVLTRISDVMQKANTSVNADINLIRNIANDPRPGDEASRGALRDLSGEAGYQAGRLENLLNELDQQQG
jgi:hypothetical protein